MKDRILQGIQDHPLAVPILEQARERGEPLYLVGGALRDMALGITPKDLDFVTEHPFEMARHFAERYGSKVVPLGKEATSTYRIPLEGFCLDWVGLTGGSIEADLKRRDFTVNAIAFDPEAREFLDPTGGFADLQQSRLCMASPSAFQDDPVRMVKAFRMLALFPGFWLDPLTEAAILNDREALLDVPPDRIHAELERLFLARRPGAAVRKMAHVGLLDLLVPEMAPLKDLAQNHYHHADVLNHSLEALENCDDGIPWLSSLDLPRSFSPQEVLILRLAALFHDLGKADTRTEDVRGVHFYGHPKPSADKALAILKRLRFSNAVAEAVSDLCLNHLRPLALLHNPSRLTALRRLVHSMGDRLPLLLALAYADKAAAKGDGRDRTLAELCALSKEVMALARTEGSQLTKLPKLVDGLRAMEILGLVKPGPELGQALDALMELQVEGKITDAAAAEAYLADWAQRHLGPRAPTPAKLPPRTSHRAITGE